MQRQEIQRVLLILCGVALIASVAIILDNNNNNKSSSSSVLLSSDDDLSTLASPLYSHPEQVVGANAFLATNQNVRVMWNYIDDIRDEFEQLKGALFVRNSDEDCDAIHDIARKVKNAHSSFEILEIEYKKLSTRNRQSVSHYMQERIIPIIHQVTTALVKSLMICESSQSLYHEAVANVRLVSAKLDAIEKKMEKEKENCPKLQQMFHDAVAEISSFHAASEAVIERMRGYKMIVAADQAQLEREARINNAEHSLYSTYASIWSSACHDKVADAFGLTSSSGGESGSSGSSAAAASSGGSK